MLRELTAIRARLDATYTSPDEAELCQEAERVALTGQTPG